MSIREADREALLPRRNGADERRVLFGQPAAPVKLTLSSELKINRGRPHNARRAVLRAILDFLSDAEEAVSAARGHSLGNRRLQSVPNCRVRVAVDGLQYRKAEGLR